MAWSNRARLSGRQIKGMFRKWRRPPQPDNPKGVPHAVMKTLSQEQLSSDPATFNARLQELLNAYKLNGG